jgi:hypothetical protein
MHQQHLNTAQTALPFIYSFNKNAIGHTKMFVSLQLQDLEVNCDKSTYNRLLADVDKELLVYSYQFQK